MIEGRLFGKTFSILSKALDLRSLNHRIISMNLANINTPNYKAQDVRFEDALQSQIERGASLTLIKTDSRHLPTHSELRSQKEDAVLREAKTRIGADGNSVDEEREMVRLAENQMMYQALAQIIKRKFSSIREAIQGGR